MKRTHLLQIACLVVASFLVIPTAQAGWMDLVDSVLAPPTEQKSEAAPTSNLSSLLSQKEMISGLKEALSVGFSRAAQELGKQGGFLNDSQVRIPMPASLAPVKTALGMMGKGALADQFIETMNRAAEKAVPVTGKIFAQTIQNMSLEDATKILQGPDDAATQYFKQSSLEQLSQSIKPLVTEATQQVGLTSAYKMLTGAMAGNTGMLTNIMGQDSLDLDSYVTRKALDGLFIKLAAEEKKIRDNPMARGTDLLKKVFGAVSL
jgi:hypothetical protein